jgi:recombination protein RecR
MSLYYVDMLPKAMQDLAEKLKYFPGVGTRSSQKLALDVIHLSPEKYEELINSFNQARNEVGFCKQCGFFAQKGQLCEICSDQTRNKQQICIVEKPTDVISMEKSQIYRGYYHVLEALISPLDNIFAENTKIGELFENRLGKLAQKGEVELILFFKAGFAGEATMAYIKELLRERGLSDKIKISRLAQGLPMYYNPDTLDQATMARALEDRRVVA